MKLKLQLHCRGCLLPRLVFIATLIVLLSGCLDSDTDEQEDNGSDSGSLSLELSPEVIQVGSLAFVDLEFSEIQFDDIESEGVTFKFALSEEFDFIPGSAALVTNQGAEQIVPSYNGTVSIGDNLSITYVVFSLSGEELNNIEEGHIQFDLQALDNTPTAIVAVDLDRGNGTFDVEHAEFDAEAEVTLAISPASD